MAARPIRALIIQPDDSYEMREITQDIQTWQGIVGGYLEAVSTEHCVFWCDEDGEGKELPCNTMATYLWWKLAPEMEGRDTFLGPVFVTGHADDASDSLPVPDAVVELYERMEALRRENLENES